MTEFVDLSNRHILVTGASKGIGRETAIQLAKMGAVVSMVARNGETLAETLSMMDGSGHSIYPFDLRQVEAIEMLVRSIVSERGTLSGVVHSAGVATMRPLNMITSEFLHDTMLVNVYSFIELTRVLAKKQNHAPKASVVGISSVAGCVGLKSKVAYCASKSALDGAVRALAVELSGKGIRVNSVAPGFVKTELFHQYIELTGKEAFEREVLSRQHLGLGEPADVANAAVYLLSDASKFVTGTRLVVDGGYLS